MSDAAAWTLILGLGALTYLIRYSFIGLLGDRKLPPLLVTCLRYVPTTVLPALVAPMVLIDRETGGAGATLEIVAAALVLVVGAATRSLLAAIVAGLGGWHLLRLAGL